MFCVSLFPSCFATKQSNFFYCLCTFLLVSQRYAKMERNNEKVQSLHEMDERYISTIGYFFSLVAMYSLLSHLNDETLGKRFLALQSTLNTPFNPGYLSAPCCFSLYHFIRFDELRLVLFERSISSEMVWKIGTNIEMKIKYQTRWIDVINLMAKEW